MLRVLGRPGDRATRIENRIGEPLANPYLYIASQIHAGLDGLHRRLPAPPAAESVYAEGAHEVLPTGLGEALSAFEADPVLTSAFGAPLVHLLGSVKRQELARFEAASDRDAWQRQEYFARY